MNTELTLVLEIDYREAEIISLFNPELQIKVSDTIYENNGVYYKICNLHIGDFIFKKYQNKSKNKIKQTTEDEITNEKEESICFIIERKTFKDLCSSIKDCRFREQKDRLSKSNCNIIYILEGDKNVPKIYKTPVSTINSAIQNLLFKHKFNVITSQDPNDTMNNLCLLYNKLLNDTFNSSQVNPIIIKKADTLNNNVFINQLCVIPGISLNIAQKIKEKYPSMNDLIVQFTNNVPGELMLSEIQITEKRKLGKILSKKIYQAFFNN